MYSTPALRLTLLITTCLSLLTLSLTTIPATTTTPPALAHPYPHPARRAVGLPGAYYICSQPNWKGACYWHRPEPEPVPCNEVGATLDGASAVASIGPDTGTVCLMSRESRCRGVPDPVIFPGWWGRNVSSYQSFRCRRMEGYGT